MSGLVDAQVLRRVIVLETVRDHVVLVFPNRAKAAQIVTHGNVSVSAGVIERIR